MKIAAVFIIIYTYLPIHGEGQALRTTDGSGYRGTGAYSLNHIDAFSLNSNKAALARIKNTTAAIYAQRRYMLNELNDYSAVFALASRSGNFAMEAGYSGFSAYNETLVGLAYARKLGNKLDVGAQFNYNGIHIPGYGSATALGFEVAALLHISDVFHTGFQIKNPVGGKFVKSHEEKLPSVYTIGFGYDASEKFCFNLEIIKEESQPVTVNAAFQYYIISLVALRAGISSSTARGWFGLGFILRSFRIDITTSYHPQLGLSPGVLMLFNSTKRGK